VKFHSQRVVSVLYMNDYILARSPSGVAIVEKHSDSEVPIAST
jgi:hypothetical protein